jgi:hypothetical protein
MELLSRSPLTRSQLMHLPWAGGLVGAINSLGFWKYLSPSGVVLLAACLGGLMLVLAAWLAYRSEFATRYGLVAPVLMWLLFGPMTTSIAVLMLSMGGDLAWRGWTVVSVGGSLLLTFMVTAVQQWRRLQREGLDGPWIREHVDAVSGRLRADALRPGRGNEASWHPILVAALAANIPLLYHTWGISDLQVMPVLLLVMFLTSVWVCVKQIGPAAGKALFLRDWERREGRTLVHENWDDLQTLRRSFWLSRWLMVKEPPPPAAAAPRLTRTQRRRGGRQA